MTEQPARRWPKTGTVGASISKDVGDHCTTGDPAPEIPARPYPGEPAAVIPLSNRVRLGDLNPEFDVLGMRAMADSLNAHGGVDEVFVAGLIDQVADDTVADARNRLGLPPAERQLVVSAPFGGEPSVAERLVLNGAPRGEYPDWQDVRAAGGVLGPLPVPPELRPRPWWRRALDRVRKSR